MDPGNIAFQYVVDCVFIVDILVTLRTSVVVDGVPMSDGLVIFQEYAYSGELANHIWFGVVRAGWRQRASRRGAVHADSGWGWGRTGWLMFDIIVTFPYRRAPSRAPPARCVGCYTRDALGRSVPRAAGLRGPVRSGLRRSRSCCGLFGSTGARPLALVPGAPPPPPAPPHPTPPRHCGRVSGCAAWTS